MRSSDRIIVSSSLTDSPTRGSTPHKKLLSHILTRQRHNPSYSLASSTPQPSQDETWKGPKSSISHERPSFVVRWKRYNPPGRNEEAWKGNYYCTKSPLSPVSSIPSIYVESYNSGLCLLACWGAVCLSLILWRWRDVNYVMRCYFFFFFILFFSDSTKYWEHERGPLLLQNEYTKGSGWDV